MVFGEYLDLRSQMSDLRKILKKCPSDCSEGVIGWL
jgi:hypothetical protein